MEQLQRALSILRRPQVEQRVGLRRSEIYRRVAKGEFPAPIRLGPNSVGWLESEVTAYLAKLVAQSRDQ